MANLAEILKELQSERDRLARIMHEAQPGSGDGAESGQRSGRWAWCGERFAEFRRL